MHFYTETTEQILESLNSSAQGLSSSDAAQKLIQHGPNSIKIKGESLWRKLLEPMRGVFMPILTLAAVISFLTHEVLDGIIILVIIFITVAIYYIQRFSAERVLRALEKHDIQYVKTYRDGSLVQISSEDLVPGDLIILGEGEKIPADARIMHADNVRSDESLLTGESEPVFKNAATLHTDQPVYKQTNMLFQGAYIVAGSVNALVVATGNNTEFGQIAALAGKADNSSPMQRKIDRLIAQIVSIVGVLAMLVFALSFYRGLSLAESLRLVLTFSVSAVPEGLPIAISVVLVLGMRRMARYKALVHGMAAIENIGIITTIATDKTGTLTKNSLAVQDVWTPHDPADLQHTAHAALLSINRNGEALHDPLDAAFVSFSEKYSQTIEDSYELVRTLPFEYQFAMSGNTWQHKEEYFTYVKGAPERIISLCEITPTHSEQVHHELRALTTKGYRVIALARRVHKSHPEDSLAELQKVKFEFLSLLAISDELREESKPSITAALNAGVTVRMITGDHYETAYAIGKELGLVQQRDQVFDCTDLDKLTDKQLAEIIDNVRVFSRVLPEYKYRILEILKTKEITAMTGDGVNDVPALTNANIGIAMGSGSQIAREAGDIVLLDDNFKSIIAAMREGRVIFDNIRRMLFYLLSTNLGEVLTTVGALVAGMPLPLLPVQILWTNLGTDTAMVIPLGLEPAEHDVMKRKPRPPKMPIISKLILSRMLLIALTMMVVALTTFSYFLSFESVTYARTMVFSALVVMQLTNAFNARSLWQSLVVRARVKNRTFYAGLAMAVSLYSLAVFGPLQSALSFETVAAQHLVVVWLIAIISITFTNELHKAVFRRYATEID